MSRTTKAASGIAVVTLGSRILGLVRDVVMFRAFGASWAMGAFVLAWMFPNMLRRLFGEGALSAALVPSYSRTLEANEPGASRRLLGAVASLLLFVLGALTVVVILLSFLLPADAIGAGPQREAQQHGQLLLNLTRILFPYSIPICLAATFAGALNCHGRFALPAAAPILLNVMWIAGVLLGTQVTEDLSALAQLVAIFLLVGGLGQMAMSLIPLMRLREAPVLMRPSRALSPTTGSRVVMRSMLPMVLGMSVLQLNALLDQLLAAYLVSPGAPSYLYMANRLLLFPHALTSLALATAVFPTLARFAARDEHKQLREKLESTLLQTVFLALPASVGLMLVADPLIELVFEHGAFNATDRLVAADTTVCLVAALPAIGSAQLHARALYALGDARTPAITAVVLLFVNFVLNLVLVLGLDLGVPGLAMATTLCSIGNHFLLRKRLKALSPEDPETRRSLLPTLIATAFMAAAVYGIQSMFDGGADGRLWLGLLDVALPVLVGVGIYAATYRLLAGTLRVR